MQPTQEQINSHAAAEDTVLTDTNALITCLQRIQLAAGELTRHSQLEVCLMSGRMENDVSTAEGGTERRQQAAQPMWARPVQLEHGHERIDVVRVVLQQRHDVVGVVARLRLLEQPLHALRHAAAGVTVGLTWRRDSTCLAPHSRAPTYMRHQW